MIPVSFEGHPTGAAQRLTNVTGRSQAPSAGPDGSVVFAVLHNQRVIERAPLSSGAGEQPPTRLYADNRSVALRASETGDGSTIVFEQGFEKYLEIWMRDTRTGRQHMAARVMTGFTVSATVSSDGARVAYTEVNVALHGGAGPGRDDSRGYVVEASGGVPKAICEGCTLHGFLSDHHRVLSVWDGGRVIGVIDVRDGSKAELIRDDEGRLDRPHASGDDRWVAFRRLAAGEGPVEGHIYVTRLVPNRPPPRGDWQRVEQPTSTGRPCGWSPDSTVVYSLLDTDGFRCVWGQRIDARTGRLDGPVFPVHHFHVELEAGVSTSYGNPVTADGLLYERVVSTGDLWRLVPATPATRRAASIDASLARLYGSSSRDANRLRRTRQHHDAALGDVN
jgi:hypothetical protein